MTAYATNWNISELFDPIELHQNFSLSRDLQFYPSNNSHRKYNILSSLHIICSICHHITNLFRTLFKFPIPVKSIRYILLISNFIPPAPRYQTLSGKSLLSYFPKNSSSCLRTIWTLWRRHKALWFDFWTKIVQFSFDKSTVRASIVIQGCENFYFHSFLPDFTRNYAELPC